jgi:hypothetical protein
VNRAKNPWRHLPKRAPYLLKIDEKEILEFNKSASKNKKIRLQILPEPFLGDPSAPVVILNLNPGYKQANIRQHKNKQFQRLSRRNLRHLPAQFPFYLLDPSIDRTKYWEQKLARLIDAVADEGQRLVAHGVFCVEYFPYHSRKFGARKVTVPSQQYSFALVRNAMAHRAVIIVMRGRKKWFAEIPKLSRYRNLYMVRSVQNPTISPRNCPKGFKRAVKALRRLRRIM